MTNKLLAAPFLLGAALGAQAPPPPIPLEFFQGRRQALMELTAKHIESGETHVIMLRGAARRPDMGSFYQDHDFCYLSGVREPDAAMVV